MKYLLLLLGPGSIIVFGVALFFQLFTNLSAIVPIIISACIFFFVFIPLFTVVKYQKNDQKSKESLKK